MFLICFALPATASALPMTEDEPPPELADELPPSVLPPNISFISSETDLSSEPSVSLLVSFFVRCTSFHAFWVSSMRCLVSVAYLLFVVRAPLSTFRFRFPRRCEFRLSAFS